MKTQLLISLKIFFFFTVLLGVAYPLLITGIAQFSFPWKANGSLILRGDQVVGSELIGQKFDRDNYFWSRPSATGYSALPSGGSNLAVSGSMLKQQIADRTAKWKAVNQVPASGFVPSEMVMASGSGLDPHISHRAAMLQVDRIAKVRNFNNEQKQQLVKIIAELTQLPQFGFLGEGRIDILDLNLALDQLDEKSRVHQ